MTADNPLTALVMLLALAAILLLVTDSSRPACVTIDVDQDIDLVEAGGVVTGVEWCPELARCEVTR